MIWIEILDRRGHVAHRVRADRLPVTVGRAWDNDVVLDDRHVDARHARIAEDGTGAVVIEDLGSVNGVVPEGSRERVDSLTVRGVATVRLGHTLVRLASPGAPVPAAVPVHAPARGPVTLIQSPRNALIVIAVGMLVSAFTLWLGETTERAETKALGGMVAIAIATVAWAGAWALAGRANVQRAAFLPHLAATWLTLLALDLSSALTGWLSFILSADLAGSIADSAAALGLSIALIATQLGLASLMPRARRVVVATAVTLALTGTVLLLGESTRDEFGGRDVTIGGTIKPLPAGLVRATSVDAFLERVEGLKRKVDRLEE